MPKLWDKGRDVSKEVEKYLASDIQFDQLLVKYDCLASKAHAQMLNKVGILNNQELQKIISCLDEIILLNKEGNFVITQSDEDVHTKVENYIVQKLGNSGKKIHTYRSRNDQVLVDTRLYNKDKLEEIKAALLELCGSLAEFAKKHADVPMPGYTHMQKAMLSSVGLWAGTYAYALLDDLKVLENAYELNNQNPLGSAASYGVPEKIDRDYVTQLLGFKKTQKPVLYCQNSRGKIESVVVNSLSQVMTTLSKLCQDLIIFSTSEFGYFKLSDKVSTGSSIMPQKRNPDVAELVKGNAYIVIGYEFQIKNLICGLPSGYAKETQVIKEPTIKSIEMTLGSLKVTTIIIDSMGIDRKKCIDACIPELFATDYAYELVAKGMPFRDAYKKAATELDNLPNRDAGKALEKRKKNNSFSLDLDELEKEIRLELKKSER